MPRRLKQWTAFGFLLAGVLFWSTPARAQAINATAVSASQLRLDWDTSPWGYAGSVERKIYRRDKGDTTWGSPIADLSNAAATLTYTDSTITPGNAYEYQIQTYANGSLFGYGSVSGGINLPVVDSRGTVLLLVDASMTNALASELAQLQQDLAGDGWTVQRHDLARGVVDPATTGTSVGPSRLAEVQNVKNVILSDYNANPAKVKSVFIVGHLPVPYSGSIYPDGHYPNHYGAWPADNYYADMTGAAIYGVTNDTTWTDSSVNTTVADDKRNYNTPGDGKFDQSYIPANVTLQVGRVDFKNMTLYPSTAVSETELLRRYLRKEHDYRYKQGAYASIARRALILDGFNNWGNQDVDGNTSGGGQNSITDWTIRGVIGRSGSLADVITPAIIDSGGNSPWFAWMENHPGNTYLVGSIASGGDQTSDSAGTSTDFGLRPSRTVFNNIISSFMGDWEFTDDFMRASLAGNANAPVDSLGLTCCWGGPNFVWDSMALGETIGYAMRVTENNDGTSLYIPLGINNCNREVHMGLLGDPTLRFYTVQPPQNLQAASSGGNVTLSWGVASPDPSESNLSYLVYGSTSANGPFTRLTPSPISSTSYTDSSGTAGTAYTYMVKTVVLETTPAGTFTNSSGGVFATITDSSAPASIPLAPTGLQVTASNSSTINLTWADNPSGETGYLVQRQSGLGGFMTLSGTLPVGTTNYTDSGPLTAGATFYYQVVAAGSAGNSLPSAVASLTGNPGSIRFAGYTPHCPRVSNYVDVPVQRLGGSVGTVSVHYATTPDAINDSAQSGVDYTGTSGTLTFADGETFKTIRVTLLKASPQPPLTFTLTLGNPTGGVALIQGLNGTYTCRALIVDSSAPLQSPWSQAVIGANTDPGTIGQVGSDLYSAYWGGSWDDGNVLEYGRFIYQPVTGDNVLTAKVSEANVYGAAIMIRGAIDSGNGPMVCIRISNGSLGTQFISRNTPGSDLFQPVTSPYSQQSYWVRITRSASQFSGEISSNNVTWYPLGTASVPNIPAVALWGFFHGGNRAFATGNGLQRAQFTNISFSSAVPIPAVPSGLSAARGSSSVNLSWTDNASIETGFIIERSLSGNNAFSAIATNPANTVLYSDTTASAALSYDYRVCAYNNSGNSAYTSIASAGALGAPAAPGNFTATRNLASVALAWSDNSSNELGFQITRSLSGSNSFTLITTVAANTISYSDTNASYSSGYDYRVYAYNGAGNSTAATASAGPLPVPAAPGGFAVTPTALNGFSLSWIDNSSNLESGFYIERRAEGSGSFTVIATLSPGTNYPDSSVSPDAGYDYRIRSYNPAGNSAYTPVISVATAAQTNSTFTAVADASFSSSSPGTSYGTNSTLNIANANGVNEADAYVRFDTSTRPAATRAVNYALSLTASGTGNAYLVVYVLNHTNLEQGYATDLWDESNLTWNNALYNGLNYFNGGKFIGYTPYIPCTGGTTVPISNNNPDLLLARLNTAGDNGLLTFLLFQNSSGYVATFASRENGTYSRPTLSLTSVSLTPRRVTRLAGAVTAPGAISLQWQDNDATATGYRIQVSTDGGSTYSPLSTTGSNASSLSLSAPAVPAVAGSQFYRVVAFNSYGDATPSLPVTLAPFTGIQAWMQTNGLPLDGSGNGALTACPANDGIPNLEKYALGLSAYVPGYQGRFITGVTNVTGTNYLGFTYTRPEPVPTGVTYLYDSGYNLSGTWSGTNPVLSATTISVSGSLTAVTVRDPLPISSNPCRFLRFRISAP